MGPGEGAPEPTFGGTVHVLEKPPVIDVGVHKGESEDSGTTAICAPCPTPLFVAMMPTTSLLVTARAVAVNVPDCAPAGIVKLPGIEIGLPLAAAEVRETAKPSLGAGPVRVTEHVI